VVVLLSGLPQLVRVLQLALPPAVLLLAALLPGSQVS